MIKYLLTVIGTYALLFTISKANPVNTPVKEYFFFELKPTKANLPYYFSQTIAVSYNDSVDLRRQMTNYFHELKMEALADKADTLAYRSFMPPGSDTKEHCENIRTTLLTTLSESNSNTKLETIHE